MNEREALFDYRLNQARETLDESRKMLAGGFSSRAIVNRAYYAMFYMLLALFLKKNIKASTSKHSGVMSIFDKEFVLRGQIDRSYSKDLHRMFDQRLEFDYKELVTPSFEEARKSVEAAGNFVEQLELLCSQE